VSGFVGRTADCIDAWKSITGNKFVLSIARGIKLNFSDVPHQSTPMPEILMSKDEMALVDVEVEGLLRKGAICRVTAVPGQFVSNLFLVAKKSGGMRPVINLKRLNKFLHPEHFKMEHILTILPLLHEGCFMTSLDLKDAYFSIPMDKSDRKYLRFSWRDTLYEFQCLCFGLSPAPFFFTKAMKPVFSQLRREGMICSYYIDDSIYVGSKADILRSGSDRAKGLLTSLGFVVNEKKSSLEPSTRITHLGFIIDSVQMKLFLPEEKVSRLRAACASLLKAETVSLRHLASVIGLMVSSFLAVRFGQLHYRHLELLKTDGLTAFGSFDHHIRLSETAKEDLHWWLQNTGSSNGRTFKDILDLGDYHYDMYTDASMKGWGAVLYRNGQLIQRCGGRWSSLEAQNHINLLELKAIQLALLACAGLLSESVCIHSDNQTAISYINKFGGCHSRLLDALSRSIWSWCIAQNLVIKAIHIPGVENVDADALSRDFNDNVEWSLCPTVFAQITDILGLPTLDAFASRLNNKLPRYYSWQPDPGCEAVNAFSQKWDREYIYAFPPFNLIGRILRKLITDGGRGLLIFPFWPSQPWFPLVADLLIDMPILLPSSDDLLNCPGRPDLIHPLLPSLQLIAGLLSPEVYQQQEFRRQLSISSRQVGSPPRRRTMRASFANGLHFVSDNKLIPVVRLSSPS